MSLIAKNKNLQEKNTELTSEVSRLIQANTELQKKGPPSLALDSHTTPDSEQYVSAKDNMNIIVLYIVLMIIIIALSCSDNG